MSPALRLQPVPVQVHRTWIPFRLALPGDSSTGSASAGSSSSRGVAVGSVSSVRAASARPGRPARPTPRSRLASGRLRWPAAPARLLRRLRASSGSASAAARRRAGSVGRGPAVRRPCVSSGRDRLGAARLDVAPASCRGLRARRPRGSSAARGRDSAQLGAQLGATAGAWLPVAIALGDRDPGVGDLGQDLLAR